jgi:NADP-dependent 3-hydroxy acid dehydrogenase YdfG
MQVAPGTRAFVTGASRGIGRALAGALAARGATLGLAARTADDLAALAAELPGEHHALACDVADAASTQAAIDGFAHRAGGLELLVANAGITHYGPFRDQPLGQALQMSQVNWHGALHTVHFGLPHLLEASAGTSSSSPAARACARSRRPRSTARRRPPSACSPRPCATSSPIPASR